MTKMQMMSLKPGDIVVDKDTGDQFRVVKLVDVNDIVPKNGGFAFVNPRKEIGAELIPGFEYAKRYVTNGPYFYFSHKKMAVLEGSK